MISEYVRAGINAIFSFLQYTGRSCTRIIRTVFTYTVGILYILFSKTFKIVGGWLTKKFKQPLYDIWCYLLTPIAKVFGILDRTRIQLKKTSELGARHAVKTCLNTAGKMFSGAGLSLRFLFNYVAPVISIAFLLSLINYASSLQYTISVEYNGNDLGVISNEADFNQAQALVQNKITYTEGDQAILQTPKFSVRMMKNDDAPVDTDQLSELMMNSSDVGIVYAYGLYINDSLIGVYSEEETKRITNALDDCLAKYYSADAESVEFEDKIEITQGRYLETNLTNADVIVNYISGSVKVEAYYVIKSGDSVESIANALGYTKDQLINENPFLADGTHSGDIVTYHFDEPNLNVISTHYETYDRVVKRTIQYIDDNSMEKYCEVLKQHGSDGYENVTALVTCKNGKETDRTIVKSYVIEEMVPRIFIRGTKENTFLNGNTTVIDALGTFVWPVGGDGGYISSLYGYREWDHSNHKGVDIPAKRNTDIYAAADGVVSFAGTYSTYGKLVIIDHGGGYETYYGHQSSIDVEKGDVVKKGDVIGHVGMTGSASGNHLHFELRYQNERMNPFYGLGGVGKHEIRE